MVLSVSCSTVTALEEARRLWPMSTTSKELLHRIHATARDATLDLYAIIIDQTNSINQSNHQLVATLVDLHGRDVIGGLLPIYHLPLIHVPDSDHFIKAARGDVVLAGRLDEERGAEDVRVL